MKGKDGLKIISPLINSKALFVTSYYQNRPNSSKIQIKLSLHQNWAYSFGKCWTRAHVFGNDPDALLDKHISTTVRKLLRQICDSR